MPQVEFYFSDSNLPTDKFLFDQVGGSENKPVPIKLIHSFKRMRHFQPYSAVVAALKESEIIEVVENDEIRRKVPIADDIGKSTMDNVKIIEDRAMPRSIYAKGFGEEGPNTQFDIEAFFAPYGPTKAVRLRRTYPEKIFKGSVFVEFDSKEMQQAFLALDSKPKFQGKELNIMSKREYVESKAEDIRAGKIKPNETRQHQGGGRGSGRGRGRGGRGRGRGGRGRDDRRGRDDDRDWRERRDGDRRNRDDRYVRDLIFALASGLALMAIFSASKDEPASEAKSDENKPSENGAAPSAAASTIEAAESKKRTHDGDAADQGDAKKSKTEEVGTDV